MEKVFISIGSNLGDRAGNCTKAVEALGSTKWASVAAVSSMYEAEPWGNSDQPGFVNCAVEVATTLSPEGLLTFLLEIEIGMGRVRSAEDERWGPRAIDLDIIFYGDYIIKEEALEVPHPLAADRAFVLVPLAEIAPEVVHPVLGKTVQELRGEVRGAEGVRRLEA